MEADLERDESLLAQVDGLEDPALLPVPEMQPRAIFAGLDVVEIEARPQTSWGAPIRW